MVKIRLRRMVEVTDVETTVEVNVAMLKIGHAVKGEK